MLRPCDSGFSLVLGTPRGFAMRRHEIPDADWGRARALRPPRPGPAAPDRLLLDAVPGSARPARRGGTCPSGSARGTPPGGGSTGGPGGASGRPRSRRSGTRTWSGWSRTRRRSAPTRARRGREKADGTGGQADQALGRSRGGFGTEVHAAASGLGLPARPTPSPGRDANVRHADALLAGFAPAVVVADKGYDEQALVDTIEGRGGGDPGPEQPQGPAGGRHRAVQGPEPGRAVLGRAGAVPAGRHAVRKDGPQLPGVRPRGVHNGLAAITVTICPHGLAKNRNLSTRPSTSSIATRAAPSAA